MAEQSSLVRLQEEFDISVDWRGFELHPETPPGGVRLAELFGAQRYAGMQAQLEQFAASFGIGGFRPADRMPNTRGALAVAELARSKGRLDPFRVAAMDAYWRRGSDLEDPAVLAATAAQAGLDPDEAVAARQSPTWLERVDAMRADAEREGVNAIPTVLLGRSRVVGCQPYDAFVRTAEAAGAKRR